MPGGFWGGFAQGVGRQLQKNRETDKERALLLLKGMIEGTVTSKEGLQPPNIGQRIMSSLGIAPSPAGNIANYEVQPNVERQLKEENLNYMRNINKQMVGTADTNGTNLIYRDAITGVEVPSAQAIQDMQTSGKKYIVTQKKVSKAGVTEVPIVTPPNQAQLETEKEARIAKLITMRNSLINQKKTYQGGFLGLNTAINIKQQKDIDSQVANIDRQIQQEQMGGGGITTMPSGITEEDIQHTLKLHPEYTREQLLKKLGVQ